jgi:hypothetical protein
MNGNRICIAFGTSIDIGNSLLGYSPSYWGNDGADRKSQGCHVFRTSNGAFFWPSRKQSLIAMSTPKAEFTACSETSNEAKRLLQLPKDIHAKVLPPLQINRDDQGALTRITTGIIKARTKHIDIVLSQQS